MLIVGPPGRGKTVTMQRLLYERFLQGSRIIDVDPKPDHRWTELPGVRDHVDIIEFRADARYRGVLDPLRIAPRNHQPPAPSPQPSVLYWIFGAGYRSSQSLPSSERAR